MKLDITSLSHQEIAGLSQAFSEIGWNKPISLFEEYLAEEKEQKRSVFVAKRDGAFVGYITILWQSMHLFFQRRQIPEIKDLNVLPPQQGQGFGKALLKHAEQEVAKRASFVGLGVGLTADYGIAQRLYTTQGYLPTGEGATHHEKPLAYGDSITVDDDTILWLMKAF